MFCNNTVTTELEMKSCILFDPRELIPVVMVVFCHCMEPFTLFFT